MMRNNFERTTRTGVFVLCILVSPLPAYAYTDPGAGLLLWQLLGSFFVGLLFYTKKIVKFIKGVLSKNDRS